MSDFVRYCGACHLPPRTDDRLQLVQWTEEEGGPTMTAYVCRDCEYRLRGQEAPPPERYPAGGWTPKREDGVTHVLICGVCRLALRDGDQGQAIRLHPDDIGSLGIKPGCYSACRECVDYFRPHIHWRLTGHPEQAGLAPDQGHMVPALAVFGADWLL